MGSRLQSRKGQSAIGMVVVMLIILALMGASVILTYNGLVKAEKTVEESWAQIATVLQRRFDLIPNLIETVKGYAAHERQTLEAVTAARAAANDAVMAVGGKWAEGGMAQIAATQAGLSAAMRSLFALVENYPNLKASSNFMALQDQFEGTENRIAVARQRYNSAVKVYNTRTETFPGVFIAPMFGFGERESWEAEEKAYEAPRAEF
ncbi:MAG: LemA family protein [Candidatus Omnitrophota bacterium]